MSKIYLKNLDRCYCTGVYLRWAGAELRPGNKTSGCFVIDQLDGIIYFDGLPVNFDDERPYIEDSNC